MIVCIGCLDVFLTIFILTLDDTSSKVWCLSFEPPQGFWRRGVKLIGCGVQKLVLYYVTFSIVFSSLFGCHNAILWKSQLGFLDFVVIDDVWMVPPNFWDSIYNSILAKAEFIVAVNFEASPNLIACRILKSINKGPFPSRVPCGQWGFWQTAELLMPYLAR